MPIAAFPVFEHLAGGASLTARVEDVFTAPTPAIGQAPKSQRMDTKMTSTVNLKSSGREAALARRRALSSHGKQSVRAATSERNRSSSARVRPEKAQPATVEQSVPVQQTPVAAPSRQAATPRADRSRSAAVRSTLSATPAQNSRAQARARRESLSRNGRRSINTRDRVRTVTKPTAAAPVSAPKAETPRSTAALNPKLNPSPPTRTKRTTNRNSKTELSAKPTGRMLSLARRSALSGRGKAASNTPNSVASLARQANPKLSGRELSQRVRFQRSQSGGAGERKSQPCGRQRPPKSGGAVDQHWKVGMSETASGQTVTGTRVGRSVNTTGDEPSTCRTITGTEYMGADIFRAFCQSDPVPSVPKVRQSPTGGGNRISGTEVGRSTRVTGDEPGTCKRVTGTDYLSPMQFESFCGVKPEPNPPRTGFGETHSGKRISGNMVGRSAQVTGDEQGANIQPTGTQYTDVQSIEVRKGAGSTTIVPQKVGQSTTLSGGTVTGTRIGRAAQVTGDEPGSCRSVTGDEYLGVEQYQSFCQTQPEPEPPKVGHFRTLRGQVVSGTQTGRSQKVTGDEPGTCKTVTGTPYAGLEQADAFCDNNARQEMLQRVPLSYQADPEVIEGRGAMPGQPDFPQPLDGAPWKTFSVSSPARVAQTMRRAQQVTGTSYESGGQITGPFGMASGKITGTEQFRADNRKGMLDLTQDKTTAETPAVSRVTGEGQSSGSRITGDDWDRGSRVTGTEGSSARRRNPTRTGGPISAMPQVERKRNEDRPVPVSRVTGSSGSTERGSLVTYSGGARG